MVRTTLAPMVAVIIVLSGCRGSDPDNNSFTVMTYNLGQYALIDRDEDFQRDDPKPRREQEAVIRILARYRPDVLAIQEIGSPSVLEQLKNALADHGVDYPHVLHLFREDRPDNLALFSRFPVVEHQFHTNDWYTIQGQPLQLERGILDAGIEVNPNYRFRILVAHQRAKEPHPLGQSEMRRREARILHSHIRQPLDQEPELNLILAGTLNDQFNTALMKEITGKASPLLHLIRMVSGAGDAWTYHVDTEDRYERFDYLMVSRGMQRDLIMEKSTVIDDKETLIGSPHRPLVATFSTMDR